MNDEIKALNAVQWPVPRILNHLQTISAVVKDPRFTRWLVNCDTRFGRWPSFWHKSLHTPLMMTLGCRKTDFFPVDVSATLADFGHALDKYCAKLSELSGEPVPKVKFVVPKGSDLTKLFESLFGHVVHSDFVLFSRFHDLEYQYMTLEHARQIGPSTINVVVRLLGEIVSTIHTLRFPVSHVVFEKVLAKKSEAYFLGGYPMDFLCTDRINLTQRPNWYAVWGVREAFCLTRLYMNSEATTFDFEERGLVPIDLKTGRVWKRSAEDSGDTRHVA